MDAQINDLESIFLDDELTHYSSQYYDPVKAHEYYERTKQLRGRTSTARLNDAGKEAASYVKDRLTGERKNKVDNKRETTNAQIVITSYSIHYTKLYDLKNSPGVLFVETFNFSRLISPVL